MSGKGNYPLLRTLSDSAEVNRARRGVTAAAMTCLLTSSWAGGGGGSIIADGGRRSSGVAAPSELVASVMETRQTLAASFAAASQAASACTSTDCFVHVVTKFFRTADPLASAVALCTAIGLLCFLLSLPTGNHSWVSAKGAAGASREAKSCRSRRRRQPPRC